MYDNWSGFHLILPPSTSAQLSMRCSQCCAGSDAGGHSGMVGVGHDFGSAGGIGRNVCSRAGRVN